MGRVLLVEDDETIRRLVLYALRQAGMDVDVAVDGVAALKEFEHNHPDIVVLDLLLPGIDGFEVCRRLREMSDTPILMLTALAQEDNEVRGLQLGADDYLTKPFSVRVFLARIEALLRRKGRPSIDDERSIVIGDLVINFDRVEVLVRGERVSLTPAEFRIIAYLARSVGQVVSSATLLRQVQDYEYDEREAQEIIKVHIRRLRHKIEPTSDIPRYIRTVRGFGYMLDVPDD